MPPTRKGIHPFKPYMLLSFQFNIKQLHIYNILFNTLILKIIFTKK